MIKIEGLVGYFATPDGNIFSTRGILSQQINKGYCYTQITVDHIKIKRKPFLTHRLIAKTFIPNPENKRTVNHINGIKTDNRVENLEWATDSENQLHSYKMGLSKAKAGKDSVCSKKVKQISLQTNEVLKIWDSLHCVTKELGFNYKNISLCALNKRPTAYGFKWEYQ